MNICDYCANKQTCKNKPLCTTRCRDYKDGAEQMSICYDCTKKRTCKNKPLLHTGCRKYEGEKYWCVKSDKWYDFYAKAETASKAKGAMWAAIQKEEEFEYYKTSFYEFVHSGLYVMQVDRFTYDCHKEIWWCK